MHRRLNSQKLSSQMKKLLALGFLSAMVIQANAALIPFDLRGTAGFGLLPGNEPGAIVGGTGGEIGAGIIFDDIALLLSINVGWGSSQGFTDLSSAASASHIHGSTASNNGNGFTQTAGVLFNLTRSSNLATGGTISQSVLLTAAQATDLNNGKFYLNTQQVNLAELESGGFFTIEQIERWTAARPEDFATGFLECWRSYRGAVSLG